MFKFAFKKLIYGFLVLFGVVTAIFFIFNAKPGNPALMVGGQHATEEIIKNIEKDLGLDLPLGKRYLLYLNDLSIVSLHSKNVKSHYYLDEKKYGDKTTLFSLSEQTSVVLKKPYLRRSYSTRRDVWDVVKEKLPDTAILALSAVGIATIIGIILGIIAAINKGTFYDTSTFLIAVTGMSAPSFFVAYIVSTVGGLVWSEQLDLPTFPFILMILFILVGISTKYINKNRIQSLSFSSLLGWGFKGLFVGAGVWVLYVAGYSIFNFQEIDLLGNSIPLPGTGLNPEGPLVDFDDVTAEDRYFWENLILPTLTLGIRPLAIVTQLTRSSMLEVMSQDYIRTAKAKGLSQYKVIVKHALRNALNPVVTAISGWFASLLAGSVFVERVFRWNGLGNELVTALQNDDLPLIMGAVIVVSSFFVLITILVDIIYGVLDPRVRIN